MSEPGLLTAFGVAHTLWLVSGIALIVSAIYLHASRHVMLSLILLTIGGFVLRLLMISTDPFLYDWDEQYHALVAKNLIAHPGTPMLYNDPVLPVVMEDWARNHIWLHKPPLFLWIIAASVKLFGATPFAVKLPSVILGTLMVPAVYGIVKRIASSPAAWIAAVLFASHSYFIQLVSGFRNTDHNDLIFSAFVIFSFWSWLRYTDSGSWRQALFTGFLVGCAVLVKWMPGMLVFGSWGLWLLSRENRTDRKKWLHLLLAAVSVVALVLPWQIHTFRYFPAEAAYEMEYNFLHFTIAIEGHEGEWYFHFDALRELMGWTFALLSVPGLVFLMMSDTRQKRGLYILAAVLFFFVFYTIAKTKMPLFMLPVVPFLLMGIAMMLSRLFESFAKQKALTALAVCTVAVFTLDPPHMITNHSSLSELAWYRDQMRDDKLRAERISTVCTEGKWIVFNYPDNSRAAFMFYTGHTAYNQTPEAEFIHGLVLRGYKIGCIDMENIPETYRNNPEITLFTVDGTLK
ncbi:MAG: glycosyltransferase family 39 protein [Bacteroidia bacterium]|nr:glycosyltransferase family 39 protein [Bacteroidia bacterium]